MSMNKFMHPRNRYRKPPDFKALAIKYPEFRAYAKQDISGKVSLNFKDVEAVRALTRTLLLADFNLDVEIPLDRLIPTLPLRLNYLLWIEDLLESNKRTSDVKGVDIGCGASCVYPLLAAKQFGWQMLATEVDMDSAFIASRNVKKNNLQDMIRIRTVNEDQLLEGVLEPNTTYNFCMCNPPFYSSTDELDPKNVSRSLNRPPPRNAHSGTTTELVAHGGETAFAAGLIRESCRLKDVVMIYSVMLGHKSSVPKVKQVLQEAGVAAASVVTSEFCQGHTTRWSVAWTLDPSISLPQPSSVSHAKKKNVPFCQTFQSDLTSTVDRLKKLLEELQITFKILNNNQVLCAMEITATENTWASSRKKRRQEKLKQKMAESSENNKGDNPEVNGETDKMNETGSGDNGETGSVQEEVVEESETRVAEASDVVKDQENVESKGSKRSFDEADESSGNLDSNLTKKPKTENTATDSNSEVKSRREPFLHGSLVLRKGSEGCAAELRWLRGGGGRDSAHQLLLYLKNNFNPINP